MGQSTNLPAGAQQTAASLATKGKEMDFGRHYSFGKKPGTNNLIDESAKAQDLSWRITNATDTDKFIVFAAYGTGLNTTQYADSAAILAASGANAIFADGVIINDEGSVSGKDLTVSSLDSKRKINEFVKTFAYNPLRITKLSFKSAKADGSKDSGNYDNMIKTFWNSPFEVSQENELNLRPLQQGLNNFNPDMLDVDFLQHSFPVILSREHFLVLQVNAGTSLTISAFIGAQDSAAQRMFRDLRKADEILLPLRRRM